MCNILIVKIVARDRETISEADKTLLKMHNSSIVILHHYEEFKGK